MKEPHAKAAKRAKGKETGLSNRWVKARVAPAFPLRPLRPWREASAARFRLNLVVVPPKNPVIGLKKAEIGRKMPDVGLKNRNIGPKKVVNGPKKADVGHKNRKIDLFYFDFGLKKVASHVAVL